VKAPNLGLLLLMGFVASVAFRDVYLRHLFGALSVFEVAFLAFGTATVAFGLGLLVFQPRQIRLLGREWRNVLIVNVTTMVSWLSYFWSLRLVEPAAANLAFSGIAPAAVLALSLAGLHNGRSAPRAWLMPGALLATIILLAIVVSTGRSGFSHLDPGVGLAGVALAALAGTVISAESIFSKRLNERGVSALAVVAVRFTFVTAIAGATAFSRPTALAALPPGAIAQQCLVVLVVMIGPIYLAQSGLRLTSPLVSGTVLAISPIATLALQSTLGGVALAPAMLAVTGLYAAFAMAGAAFAGRRMKAEKSDDGFAN
jgi:drug/metabolite transporter (DMT)-like permease